MGGTGVEQRMAILRGSVDQQIVKPFRTHGWTAEITGVVEAGEYMVVTATKLGKTKKVALLYSSATDNRVYKALDSEVDRTFTNGELYKPESFAYGLTKPVTPIDEFYSTLIGWNKELFPANTRRAAKSRPSTVRRIKAENPLISVWARLDQFASTHLAEKLILRRASEQNVQLIPGAAGSKGEGLAFTLRSASDYFKSAQNESLNRKIISLYYGTLALSFAEILASPSGPVDLDEIEGYTKQGHGLYTFSTQVRGFSEMGVGVLATGFLPRWAAFLGHDISHYPKSKPKADDAVEKLPRGVFCTVRDLFATLPELADLFSEVFESEPSWIMPSYDMEASRLPSFKPQQQSGSSYIKLIDRSGKVRQERIEGAGWPLAELSRLPDQPEGQIFRARVDHPDATYWHEVLPIHQSSFENSGALILPALADLNEYRVTALCLLYALSIMVRYMPSTWRRVEGGDLDQYLTIVKTALSVFERSLPQLYLETITGEHIVAVQPGSLLG
ncbi:YaaC family protein [Lichenibacterium dinghuense]|uniref:YaaC family protein n=1 Tax=Lichenibacterium dinghuense TaxID=2895977 RepID=UPI001F337DD1|nr:hypothetical protein [Lichenibacterium sp. 6Y81]